MCKMLELTVICFACGMPSSSLWAKRVLRRQPRGGGEGNSGAPFYPQIEGRDCPPGAIVLEDGTCHLCAFCFALFDAQARYGVIQRSVAVDRDDDDSGDDGNGSQNGIGNFVCGVCGVETYRKRVRALPLQKFHFLMKMRKPGSISINLGDSECAVVCLDCSETLWVQSDEYDRWNLPQNQRHFNWVTRPPPPENSEEANFARLPSGKSQIPRSPPTEPVISQLETDVQMLRHDLATAMRDRNRRDSVSSNSNSSGSNFQIDVEGDEPTPPQRKRKKTLPNASEFYDGCRRTSTSSLMEQTLLPHLESLGLNYDFSPHQGNTTNLHSVGTPLQRHPHPVTLLSMARLQATDNVITFPPRPYCNPNSEAFQRGVCEGMQSIVPRTRPMGIPRPRADAQIRPELILTRYHHSIPRTPLGDHFEESDVQKARHPSRIPVMQLKRDQNLRPTEISGSSKRCGQSSSNTLPSSSRRQSVPVLPTKESREIALLPKKRRSWDQLNKMKAQGVSVLKYAPAQMEEKKPSNQKARHSIPGSNGFLMSHLLRK